MTDGDADGDLLTHYAPLLASNVMTSAGLGLRPATPDDQSFLRAVYADTRAAEVSRTGWPEPIMRAFLDQQFDLQSRHYAARHPGADRLILTVRNGDSAEQRIGRLYLDRTETRWRLLELALLTPWRCRGFGGLFLDSLAQAASAQGASAIDLSVAVDNPRAQALYARHGYRLGVATTTTHKPMSRPVS